MRRNDNSSLTLNQIRKLLVMRFALAFVSLPACSTIVSVTDQSRATQHVSPQRLSHSYESPIPRWNSPYQGATSNQTPAEKKSLARAYQVLDVADVIGEAMSGLFDPNSSDQFTPLALSFCTSGGAPLRREKDWFGNVFSLQPGGLASSIVEGRLQNKCRLTHRQRY